MNQHIILLAAVIASLLMIISFMWREIINLRKSRDELYRLKNEIRIKKTIDRITKL